MGWGGSDDILAGPRERAPFFYKRAPFLQKGSVGLRDNGILFYKTIIKGSVRALSLQVTFWK